MLGTIFGSPLPCLLPEGWYGSTKQRRIDRLTEDQEGTMSGEIPSYAPWQPARDPEIRFTADREAVTPRRYDQAAGRWVDGLID